MSGSITLHYSSKEIVHGELVEVHPKSTPFVTVTSRVTEDQPADDQRLTRGMAKLPTVELPTVELPTVTERIEKLPEHSGASMGNAQYAARLFCRVFFCCLFLNFVVKSR